MASDINKLDVVMFSILSNTRTGVDTGFSTVDVSVVKQIVHDEGYETE